MSFDRVATRRAFLAGAGAAIALPALPSRAAEPWPTKPVRMIVGYPAGGANDLVARSVAAGLAEELGQTVVVDNRTGAAGAIGAEAAAKSPPDGHTLYMMSSAQTLAPALRKQLAYDPVKDFTAIALTARSSYVLCVHPSVPLKSMAELIAYAKANPEKLSYASSGAGAGPHLATELFASMAGVKLTHVPYRGDTPALADLVAGQVQMSFMSMAPVIPHVKSGAVRALAVASGKRSTVLPDVPTVAEQGLAGYDVGSWWGLVAPVGTPAAVVERVAAFVVPYLKTPAIRQRFSEMGLEPGDLSRTDFQAFIASETKKLAGIVKRAGIQPE
jgi:tripartite-type tricarboxylate transporter receptor subunit TctC